MKTSATFLCTARSLFTAQKRGISLLTKEFDRLAAIPANDRLQQLQTILEFQGVANLLVDEQVLEEEAKDLQTRSGRDASTLPLFKKVVKTKVLVLNKLRVEDPEEYERVKKAFREYEDAFFKPSALAPSIVATCESAYDTKNHKFVTDYVGSAIYKQLSDKAREQEKIHALCVSCFGLSPRKQAERILAILDKQILKREVQAVSKKGDLPAWLSAGPWQSKRELLDGMLSEGPEDYGITPPWRKRGLTKEEAVQVKIDFFTKPFGLEPNDPEGIYAEIERGIKQEMAEKPEIPPPAWFNTLVEAHRDVIHKRNLIKEKFAAGVLKDGNENPIQKELSAEGELQGEHISFLYALSSFLEKNKNPTREQKLKFMKVQRDLIAKGRRHRGIDLRAIFPHLTLPQQVSEDTLVERFDQSAREL